MSFNRPTLPELKSRAAADLNAGLSGSDALLRRSNTNVLATVHAGGNHGLYGRLDYLADQLMPDTAEAEYLERWAGLWGVFRKAAAKAVGPATITGNNGTPIPAATVLQRQDGVIYTTVADSVIAAGTATLNLIAEDAGVVGNAAAGSQLTLVSPIDGINSAAVTAAGGILGGIDIESDKNLLMRLLKRIQYPPHGGADFDYVDWALEVAGVTRAWSLPNWLGVGTIGVTFVLDDQADSIIPSPAKVAEVAAYIDRHDDPATGKKVGRPVTAEVTVFAPSLQPMNLTIRLVPDTVAVRTAVAAELDDMLRREAKPGGAIIFSWINEAISVTAGETDHKTLLPLDDYRPATGGIATLGVITWA